MRSATPVVSTKYEKVLAKSVPKFWRNFDVGETAGSNELAKAGLDQGQEDFGW